MYANLSVKIGDYEAIAACEVRIDGTTLTVVADENDGESYAVEGETHTVDLADADTPPVRITADF